MSIIVRHSREIRIQPGFVLIEGMNVFTLPYHRSYKSTADGFVYDLMDYMKRSLYTYGNITRYDRKMLTRPLAGDKTIKEERRLRERIRWLLERDGSEPVLSDLVSVLEIMIDQVSRYRGEGSPIDLIHLSMPILSEGIIDVEDSGRVIRQYILETGVMVFANMLLLPGDSLVFTGSILDPGLSRTQGRINVSAIYGCNTCTLSGLLQKQVDEIDHTTMMLMDDGDDASGDRILITVIGSTGFHSYHSPDGVQYMVIKDDTYSWYLRSNIGTIIFPQHPDNGLTTDLVYQGNAVPGAIPTRERQEAVDHLLGFFEKEHSFRPYYSFEIDRSEMVWRKKTRSKGRFELCKPKTPTRRDYMR